MNSVNFECEEVKRDLIRMVNSYIEVMKESIPNYKEPEIITLELIKEAFDYFYYRIKVKEPNFGEITQKKKLETFGFRQPTNEELEKMQEVENHILDGLLCPLKDDTLEVANKSLIKRI